ncbi:MAG: MBL fold metallo-hydrolase [Bacteroidota bacterium]|nr:MBL fold metallo-hydrolase [Bacteroidota bacterium]
MEITFLGTGTSQGVPIIGCKCKVCTSPDPRDNRLRSSVHIEVGGFDLVIDSGPDFRQQMLRHHINKLDGLIFTHGHKDHVAGLDDIRAYNYIHNKPVDVYADERVERVLRKEFSYIFDDEKYPGVPEIHLHPINSEPFYIHQHLITPIEVMHYRLPVLGFRVGDFTYITDANYISEKEIEKIRGSKILVLNALRREKHISHFTLEEAVEMSNRIGVETTYFTHISHQLGIHEEVNKELPENIRLAYDGLVVSF